MSQPKTRAQLVDERQERSYTWRRFREWLQDSLFVVPLLFLIGAVLLALALRRVDHYLLSIPEIPPWWLGNTDTVVTVTTVISSSMLAFLAVVFSVTLVALQLASQQFSPRVVRTFERSGMTKVTLSLFMATFVFSMVLLSAELRAARQQVTLVSVMVAVLLVFASLIVFVAFLRAVLIMLRVAYTISDIADETRQAIQRHFPAEDGYVLCQAEPLGEPDQVIGYGRPPRRLFATRYAQGVLQATETVHLVQIARRHGCVLRVIPRHGDYVIQGDPLVEVYGASGLEADGVLAAFHVGPERTVTQDPAYGLRILVDVALQALSPAVNAPTTATQVIYRLTDLLAVIAQKPAPTGLLADHEGQLRVVRPTYTWEDHVDLAFDEIRFYGIDQPQTRRQLSRALDYLLDMAPEACRPALERQKRLLLQVMERSQSPVET
jgi:uncharacterized membrane protein